jgi:LCP family protein required for cell wall assembly
MGMGGGNHEGSDLTDTIIVMSVKPENSTMSLISLPRDIWSETLQDKINSAYHYGEAKVKGGGITLAKVVIEDIIGIPLHYALIMDFSEFKTIIDLAGGIDINIRNGFTDKDYPVEGKENDECGGDPLYRCRYREVTFISGTQHMDGETALIYVRSRHAEGDEGTDFSRSRRQQEVLVALKDELSRPLQIIRLRQNLNIFRALDKATDTDMTVGVLLTLIKTGGKADSRKIRKITLDDMFTSPPEYLYGGRYVLIPKTSNSDIAVFVQNQLEQN